jgi:hypothetical protein
MKVTLEKNYRDYYTLSDLQRAKAVIKFMKEEDSSTVKEYAEYAVREALRDTDVYDREIITAEAHTAGNRRVWDAYGEGTASMDVWIEALARTSEGFIEFGAYLTDIWQTGVEHYKQNMYIKRFKEV